MFFTVGKKKGSSPPGLTCSEERERGAVAVSQQRGHLEAPRAERLLPVNPIPGVL